jgi:hypothetical protein
VRFLDFQALRQGHGFKIAGINGAGGEATHIWDRNTPILAAHGTLFKQVAFLFAIGARNRRRGFTPATGWNGFASMMPIRIRVGTPKKRDRG